MKQIITTILLIILTTTANPQSKKGLKVFISVDMEGITGVANWEDVSREGKDYDYFRKIMTEEANAAIEGALDAGAAEIIIRDSHGSARNLLPELLNKYARLIRDWSGGFMSMMEGIDETFDAVVFIGYHAKAGTPNAILEHTMSSRNLLDVSINNLSLPEAGINGLIAGYFNVPVVFAAGEKALCDQVKKLMGDVETVAVKEGIGNSTLSLHPKVSQDSIRKGVREALTKINKFKPFRLEAPYTLVIKYKNEEMVHEKSYYPGAERTGNWELTFKSNDLLEVIKAFHWMH